MTSEPRYNFGHFTIRDFERLGKLSFLDEVSQCYVAYWSAFNMQATAYEEQGEHKLGQLCSFLGHVMSMYPTGRKDEPLQPKLVTSNACSFTMEDITSDQLTFFEQLLDKTDNVLLKARFADILCIKRIKPFDMALVAIENYISVPIDHDLWYRGTENIWKRAVALCQQFGKTEKVAKFSQKLQDLLWYSIQVEQSKHTTMILSCVRLLSKLCYKDTEKKVQIIEKLKTIAKDLSKQKNYFLAECYLDEILSLIRTDKEASATILALKGDWICLDAAAGEQGLRAAQLYGSAIKVYRCIASNFRDTYQINQKIDECRLKMRQENQAALLQMEPIESKRLDCREIVKQAQAKVRGKGFMDSLVALSFVLPLFSFHEEKREAVKNSERYVFTRLFDQVTVDSEGRVISYSPAITHVDTESEELSLGLFNLMIKEYTLMSDFNTRCIILPALEVFLTEHEITPEILVYICRQSSVIPPGREKLWAQGLYQGFLYDFAGAIHILIPQLEQVIRYKLQELGEDNSILEDSGTEVEKGLNQLLKSTRILEVMDENIKFEIQALFTEKAGFNLRNSLAHGLLDDKCMYSTSSVYTWWFCLRLTMLPVSEILNEHNEIM